MTYTKYALGLVIGATVAAFVAAPAEATNDKAISSHKVGICHATGSDKNPYVYIVVDKHAAEAHKKHQNGKDIIGVTSNDACKKPVATATPTPKPTPAGSTLGTSTQTPGKGSVVLPTTLPETGAEHFSLLIGLPAMAAAGAAYLRSRKA